MPKTNSGTCLSVRRGCIRRKHTPSGNQDAKEAYVAWGGTLFGDVLSGGSSLYACSAEEETA